MILPTTKLIFYDDPEFQKVFSGIEKLHKAVAMTLGPRSRAVLMDRQFAWNINKDGVSVAKSIYLEDPVEAAGLKVVREAAQKTADESGDGTTGTIIMAQAIIKESLKLIASGVKPMALDKPLEKRVKELLKELQSYAIPVNTLEQMTNIATISASGDEELGALIAETLYRMGDNE